MRRVIPAVIVLATALAIVSANADTKMQVSAKPDPRGQVFAAESSFAHTMAARDLEAFGSLVATDAIFFGRRGVMHGKAEVVAGWKPLFEGPKAPFSWRPEVVEVLESGTLAHSSGPVMSPDGKVFGTFNSVWRLEPDGRWLVVFDKGCDVCDTTKTE